MQLLAVKPDPLQRSSLPNSMQISHSPAACLPALLLLLTPKPLLQLPLLLPD